MVRAQAGEVAAFESLYDHFYDRIYRYVSFKAGDPTAAEDMQDAFGGETSACLLAVYQRGGQWNSGHTMESNT